MLNENDFKMMSLYKDDPSGHYGVREYFDLRSRGMIDYSGAVTSYGDKCMGQYTRRMQRKQLICYIVSCLSLSKLIKSLYISECPCLSNAVRKFDYQKSSRDEIHRECKSKAYKKHMKGR